MTRYTNKGLMKYARQMLEYKAVYWYGVKGAIASESLYLAKRKQYPDQYNKWSKESFVKQYGKKAMDCSGLPESYLGSQKIDANGYVLDPYQASVIVPAYDWSANTTIEKCKEKGNISDMPEIEGLILWKDGHVGLYDGMDENGVRWCIEMRGHMYGCVRTKVSDRGFKMWGKHPAIEYIKDDPQPAPAPVGKGISLPEIKKGDKNDSVTLMQLLLNDLGFRDQNGDLLALDGSDGGKSTYSLNSFKKANGMAQDSICTEATWDKLLHKRFKEYPKK